MDEINSAASYTKAYSTFLPIFYPIYFFISNSASSYLKLQIVYSLLKIIF